MSYISRILYDYKNYESDDYNPGLALYKSLFNKEGGIRSSWVSAYRDWLNEVCDLNQIPEGEFRDCWVKDMMEDNETENAFYYIKLWFQPEESEASEESEEEADDSDKSETDG